MNKRTLKISMTAMIASVAIVLSYIEMIIPDIPYVLPGMKLGLSNIAIMFSLFVLDLPATLFICIIKSLFVLLMRGTVSFIMSLVGGLLSAIVMFLLIRVKKPTFGYIGIGISGAFFHNLGQILVAFIITDSTIFAYLPFLSLSSLVTGFLTSLVLYLVMPKVMKLKVFDVNNF